MTLRRKPELDLGITVYIGSLYVPVRVKTIPKPELDWTDPKFDVEIACKHMSLDEWLKNYRRFGNEHGYRTEVIEQYGRVLRWLDTVLEVVLTIPSPPAEAKQIVKMGATKGSGKG